jgi:hypothetical protein
MRGPKGFIDLTGKMFGEWVVLKRVPTPAGRGSSPSAQRTTYYLCRCSCGIKKILRSQSLREGHSKRCAKCATEAQRGKVEPCLWCRYPARPKHRNVVEGKGFECPSCARRASRNGRDADGAPIVRDNRRARGVRLSEEVFALVKTKAQQEKLSPSEVVDKILKAACA